MGPQHKETTHKGFQLSWDKASDGVQVYAQSREAFSALRGQRIPHEPGGFVGTLTFRNPDRALEQAARWVDELALEDREGGMTSGEIFANALSARDQGEVAEHDRLMASWNRRSLLPGWKIGSAGWMDPGWWSKRRSGLFPNGIWSSVTRRPKEAPNDR